VEPWELIAREAARDLVARYNANGDAGRLDAVLALFTAEAVLEVLPDETFRGRDGIRTLLESASEEPAQLLRHFTSTHQIDVADEDHASGRCYYAVLTENGLDHWGRYVDSYLREGGVWRFARRRVSVDGRVPGGWADRAQARRRAARPDARDD
jgi:ketosteroid isomerase-like protein